MDAFSVIRRPVCTEKGHAYIEDKNTYVFEVSTSATKQDVRDAVKHIWDVEAISVRTMNVAGKPKRYRFRKVGYTRTWKKAYVRLAENQAIDELK